MEYNPLSQKLLLLDKISSSKHLGRFYLTTDLIDKVLGFPRFDEVLKSLHIRVKEIWRSILIMIRNILNFILRNINISYSPFSAFPLFP